MTTKITIYATTWCPDCYRIERVLTEHNIPFEKIDIERVAGAAEIVMKHTGGKHVVPTVVVRTQSAEAVFVNPRPLQLLEALSAAEQL
ncbi:MAG: glutaredoxin family protein [Chloroherpetonaceae bacterium]|nr:glutaredoxin family protein [Chloroherpetonaceae bacterium]MCS7210292.1 glutaredoxin family protein [Chloroherpetonaceae bacterium]MDW8020091.1 glutaredoxin family protein [Chloroherpetonaceae bacterium]MDW8464938.1 glutaredoxin family protein [Chloroherpetonaceae bacterium]